MKHQYSLAHLTALMLSPPDLIDAASKAGYDYVGLRANRVSGDEPLYGLINDARLRRETKVHLADTGVAVLDLELARIGPRDDAKDLLPLLETAADLGAHNVIAQLPDPDHNRVIDQFGALCDLARPLGVYANLEFPWWSPLPDLSTTVSILRAADRANGAILIDMLHFRRSKSSQEVLASLPKRWFRYVHVCDAPMATPLTNEEAFNEARAARLFPGEGGLQVKELLNCMPQGIPYALEIPRLALARVLGDEGYVRVALEASRHYLDHEASRSDAHDREA